MDQATTQLLQMGLPGIVIVALALACYKLFNALQASQEKRIAEAVENRTAIERNTSAITALTEVVRATRG
jgi:hypothetical protein